MYGSQLMSNQQFAFPTTPFAQSTHNIRAAGLQARADIAGAASTVPSSFEQLKTALINENFISALGRHAVDDPARIDKLTLANVRQNPLARNSLASLHAARTCLHGARQLGDRKWYSDKPGIPNRLKTQTQRRQFRLGLVANLAFYNQLNISDLQSLVFTGDVSGLAAVPSDSPLTIDTLRTQVQQTAPHDILRVLAPEKAAGMAAVLRRITALAEYVQSLCGYLAANEELEPVHSVLCNLLRTGADFERALNINPLHLAAGAIKHLCTQPDADGALPKKKPTLTRTNPARRRYPLGLCHAFQIGNCTRPGCRFAHECARCRSSQHGERACTSSASNPPASRSANQ